MVNQDTFARLNEVIGNYLAENNFEVVELIFRYEGRNLVLRLFVEKPEGGITLDECATLNRRLGELLEAGDILPESYLLEVSSPGLDRELKTREDFTRCLRKQAVFYLNDLVGGKYQQEGLISRVDEGAVFIEILKEHNSAQVLEIPLTKINKAKLIIQKR